MFVLVFCCLVASMIEILSRHFGPSNLSTYSDSSLYIEYAYEFKLLGPGVSRRVAWGLGLGR